MTSKGRQQTSQSVTNRCEATLASMASSKVWPQNGHCTGSVSNMPGTYSKPWRESSGHAAVRAVTKQ
jgi:hypothetical protein